MKIEISSKGGMKVFERTLEIVELTKGSRARPPQIEYSSFIGAAALIAAAANGVEPTERNIRRIMFAIIAELGPTIDHAMSESKGGHT